MKFQVEAAGHTFNVETLSSQHVKIDGEDLHLDAVDGHVLVDGRSIRYGVRRNGDGRTVIVLLNGREIAVRVEEAGRAHARRVAPTRASDGEVTAPMNGQVVKVLHAVGDAVEKGDVVLVLEAMKMENEVAAPVRGIIQEFRTTQGVTVRPGDMLFIVAPSP